MIAQTGEPLDLVQIECFLRVGEAGGLSKGTRIRRMAIRCCRPRWRTKPAGRQFAGRPHRQSTHRADLDACGVDAAPHEVFDAANRETDVSEKSESAAKV